MFTIVMRLWGIWCILLGLSELVYNHPQVESTVAITQAALLFIVGFLPILWDYLKPEVIDAAEKWTMVDAEYEAAILRAINEEISDFLAQPEKEIDQTEYGQMLVPIVIEHRGKSTDEHAWWSPFCVCEPNVHRQDKSGNWIITRMRDFFRRAKFNGKG